MKKIITSITATTLLLGTVLPTAFAEERVGETYVESSTEINPESSEYSYVYEGINFTSNVELEELELQDLYSEVMRNSLGSEAITPMTVDAISPMTVDIGSNSTTVIKPEYKTFKNTIEKAAVDLLIAIILTKLPLKISGSVLATYYIGKLTGWISGSVKTVYAGSWVSRSWSEYDKTYIYKATLVHYTDSTYNTPKDVAYYEVGRSTDPNLATW
ncbi:hypothetical protein LYSIN_01236 [Lysinibacillus sphaericus]|uniref:Uncharacterized protein n=1 Tax=Lysinibacillus sphaericus TaxID=1421 RepID=A0A2S5D057_LYSSH|nr:hypothetical protein [Lysinibacillus sphaericus]POZ56453.1 hypothetical protein LYSIN_01236 [Lysinibacillus sphaericus]